MITVFDSAGRRVRMVWAGRLPAGARTVRWDGRDKQGRPVPSGIYGYDVEAGGTRRARQVVILR